MNGVSGPREGVLTISTRGFFLRGASTPRPSFTIRDLIEDQERALLGPLLKRVPKSLLPVVLMFQPYIMPHWSKLIFGSELQIAWPWWFFFGGLISFIVCISGKKREWEVESSEVEAS